MKKHTESEKKCVATWTARFYRRAAGRITKKEAEKIGRRYGLDIHWKYMGSSGDKLSFRKAGEFHMGWEQKARYWREDATRHVAYYFCWYGPNSGIWPGDKLVPSYEGGKCRGWVVERGLG